MQEEVQKNRQDYSKTIDRLKVDTAKLMDIQTKGNLLIIIKRQLGNFYIFPSYWLCMCFTLEKHKP